MLDTILSVVCLLFIGFLGGTLLMYILGFCWTMDCENPDHECGHGCFY